MQAIPEVPSTDKYDVIDVWRNNVKAGPPASPAERPLDPPVVALETLSTSNEGRVFNLFMFPDFEEPQLSTSAYTSFLQIKDSRSHSATTIEDTCPADVHLKPLPERRSTLSLTQSMKENDKEVSSVTYASPKSQPPRLPGNFSSSDLVETTVGTTPNPDAGSINETQAHTQNRRPNLQVIIPDTAAGDIRLLNGSPFSLDSADSTSTRSSICAPSRADIIKKVPRRGVARTRELSRSRTSISATIAQAETADVSIPIFPYAHLTTRCRAEDCPVSIPHEKGPYLHEGKLRMRNGSIFGASNPPPNVWDAYDRLRHGFSNAPEDVRLVDNFKVLHFGFAQQENLQVLGSPARSLAGSWKLPSRSGGLLGRLMRLGACKRK